VFESAELKVEMKSDHFRFIQLFVCECGKESQILSENLQFEYLEDKDLSEFAASVTVEELSSSMWTALSKRLVQKVCIGVPATNGIQREQFLVMKIRLQESLRT
jgi:hypothetical protein